MVHRLQTSSRNLFHVVLKVVGLGRGESQLSWWT